MRGPPPFSDPSTSVPLSHLHMALNGAHLLGSRLQGEGLPSAQSLCKTELCISETEKSQANGRNLHFEHVCFCVVEPEIPYLLMESLIFGGWVGEGLCCYILWGCERLDYSDMGPFPHEVLRRQGIGLKKHSQPLKS